MSARVLIGALAVLLVCGSAFATTYYGTQVIRFTITDSEQYARIEKIVATHNLDVWAENRLAGTVDVHFRTIPFAQVADSVVDIDHEVTVEDVQALLNHHMLENAIARRMEVDLDKMDDSWWQSYHTTDEIMSFLNSMVSKYPTLASLQQIGTTGQGNPIVGIKIHSSVGGAKKPMVVYNSLQHAREWISGATTTYIINQLLSGYGSDSTITKMVDGLDWFIVPILNVDGYRHTWDPKGSRLWRKNRRQITSSCSGVDPNRNWDYAFKPSSEWEACTETYAGTKGFSEPESSAVAYFLRDNKNVVAYIDFHAYSQLLMWPWAHQRAPADDQAKMATLGNKMSQSITAVHGTRYTAGQVYQTIYPAYGSSIDYAYGTTNVTYSYVIELRDTGSYGFILPPSQIIPNCQEVWASIKVMGNYLIDNNVRR